MAFDTLLRVVSDGLNTHINSHASTMYNFWRHSTYNIDRMHARVYVIDSVYGNQCSVHRDTVTDTHLQRTSIQHVHIRWPFIQ
jgi:hypothetical protein